MEDDSNPSCIRVIEFGKPGETESIQLKIPEERDERYGLFLWPCALVLARHVWDHRRHLRAKTILELGAGCALPGLLAAKLGAHVTLSDAAHLPACCQQASKSAELNDMPHIRVLPITWGEFTPVVTSLPAIDVILGSDCFYDPADFEDILVTVAYILERNPEAEFWASYQQRSSDRSLETLLQKWGLCVRNLSVDPGRQDCIRDLTDHPDLGPESRELASTGNIDMNVSGMDSVKLMIIKRKH